MFDDVQKWIHGMNTHTNTLAILSMQIMLDGCKANAHKLCADAKRLLIENQRMKNQKFATGLDFLNQSPRHETRTLLFHVIRNVAFKANDSINMDKYIAGWFRLPPGMLMSLEFIVLKACDFRIYRGCLEAVDRQQTFEDSCQQAFRGFHIGNHAGRSSKIPSAHRTPSPSLHVCPSIPYSQFTNVC